MKKSKLSLLLLTFMSLNSLALDPISVRGKRLSALWTLQYSGADLVKEEIKTSKRVPFGVVDTGFTKEHINLTRDIRVDQKTHRNGIIPAHHGTSVANVINHPIYGASNNVDFVLLRKANRGFLYKYIVEDMLALDERPRIISNSVGWTYKGIPEHVETAHNNGILWFLASGNDHPEPVYAHEEDSKAILIGSYAPSGLQSNFSQIGHSVVVLAPADDFQQSINAYGKVENFGYTSGATPLVSGSVANYLAVYDHLNREDVIEILKGTALSSFEQQHSIYKVGLFNAYKGFRVVKELKELCPKGKRVCIDKNLQKAIAKRYSYAYEKGCHSDPAKIKELRKAFLLDEYNLSVINSLKCSYYLIGLDKNAEFFENRELMIINPKELINRINLRAISAFKRGDLDDAYTRDFYLFDKRVLDVLVELRDDESSKLGGYWAREFISRYVLAHSMKLFE